jgi:hypothetical protein
MMQAQTCEVGGWSYAMTSLPMILHSDIISSGDTITNDAIYKI